MNLNSLKNKKICILGLGIENQALVEFLLKKKVKCDITICDARKEIKIPKSFQKLKFKMGKNYDTNSNQYDIIFRVAGYPLFSPEIKKALRPSSGQAQKAGAEITSPIKLFFDVCPSRNIIGVTGTKGKGTTSSLIYHILKSAGKRSHFGGNIGTPVFSLLNKIKKNDWVVLELSSFQLEDLEKSPHISVIINFTREHLAPADPNNPNYHKSMKFYWEAKANIFKFQKKNDYLILSKKINKKIKLKSKIVYFKKSELPSNLVGEHNKENIAAAIEVAKIIKIKKEVIAKAVKTYKGLEHRIEFVKKIKGASYYNDTFATTPEAAITAMKSFEAPIVLLAGGADKGSDFKQFARVVKKVCKFVVLLNGKATPKIKNDLIKAGYLKNNIKLVYNINEAVKIASRNSIHGDVILLSPACASFGMFKNYKERGKLFKNEVKKLT